jgi:enamine deaminase RidA (YjgF/YER057c/UK114 family)
VEKVLARRFTKAKPAVTLVVSEQTMPGALVSGDAVGLAGAGKREKEWLYSKEIYRTGPQAHAAVLPTGTRIFLSGKGGKGPTAEATRSILAELKAVMDFVQVRPADIVQIRIFLQRVGETRQQDEVMTEFFGSSGCPPVTYIDRAGDASMEIEMIAAGSPAPSKSVAQIEYLTPPKWKASPVFSQIARVNRGGLIYVSGLTGDPAADSEAQARSIFERTEAAVRAGGGDMRHLVKALYYITGKEGGTGMDKLRPKVFAADRPPAASRNNLRHVGGEGSTMLIDMIGVVVE